MHGNETTTTKAVFDFLNFLSFDEEFSTILLRQCSLCIIPVLNPDGANNFTRVNSNLVDLNRDAQNQSQSESQVLQRIFNEFKPDLCFNMHDQRTIFSAGSKKNSATVSFLSPAYNQEREINDVRATSMSLIAYANLALQEFIPNQVGRYDDAFNINCIGDYFQNEGIPTILFEAGHFSGDYKRNETRKYIFIALLEMLVRFMNEAPQLPVENYFQIPENEKLFFDVILRNININSSIMDVAIQFKETLVDESIDFLPYINKIGDLSGYFGHREIDAGKQSLKLEDSTILTEGERLSSFTINHKIYVM
jgi:hypothetical protein